MEVKSFLKWTVMKMGNFQINKTLLLLISIAFTEFVFGACGIVKMRVVQDSANYGYYANNVPAATLAPLTARVNPANFSGPPSLQQLIGNCFNTTTERYRYIFCPFENMTQYELQPKWNAYQGVLGVWGHWKIENNTFASMVLTHGDPCGDIDRSVEVLLQCGRQNEIMNVTEPKSCYYVAIFTSRLFCHSDSLLVYPRLNSTMQDQWDHLWTDFQLGYISEKGYNASLIKLLDDTGLTKFLAESSEEDSLRKNEPTLEKGSETTKYFNNIDVCNQEYNKLKREVSMLRITLNEEIEALKIMHDLSNVGNRTRRGPS